MGQTHPTQCCRCSNCNSSEEIDIHGEMKKWNISDVKDGKKGRCPNKCGGTTFLSCYEKDNAGRIKLKNVCDTIRSHIGVSGEIKCRLPTSSGHVNVQM